MNAGTPQVQPDMHLESGSYLHGSAVAVGERALLIIGAPGAGKTTLAMEMIALGAELIADDRVEVQLDDARQLSLSAPPGILGLIEMRGFGLIRLAVRPLGALKLIADLDHSETERMPPRREQVFSGIVCPIMSCKGRPSLAAALTCLLRAEDWPGPEFFAGEQFARR